MYLEHFALDRKPFTVTPDPHALYENARYREAYATLVYGVRERKGFILLTGEVGTGKTTLLRRLMDDFGTTVRLVLLYHTTLTFEELVGWICAELSLSVDGLSRVQMLSRLNDFLVEEAQRSGTVVLLIDEAQHLGPDVLENLRLLSNLETSTDKLLQIVLVGQPELEAKLADRSLRQVSQRVALRYRLAPLDAEEVEAFIAHRLAVAGRPRQDIFTARAIRRIAQYSRGIPRVVNVLCDAALLIAYASDSTRVTARMIDEAAADLRIARPGAPGSTTWAPHGADDDRRPVDSRPRARGSRGRSPWSPSPRLWPAGFRMAAAIVALVGTAMLLAHTGASAALLGALGTVVSAGARMSIHTVMTWIDGVQRLASLPSAMAVPPADGAPGGQRPAAASSPARAASGGDRGPEPGPSSMVAQPSASPVTAPTSGEGEPHAMSARGAARDAPDQAASMRIESGRAPATRSWPGAPQVIAVPRGSTISSIAAEYYGTSDPVVLDLISEVNGHVGNLDRIQAGDPITLPALDQDAFARRQRDGSYLLILDAFPSAADAERLAQTVRRRGYVAVVTTRRVTPALSFHRVEIAKLGSRDAVREAWGTAARHGWLTPRVSDAR